MYVKNFFLENQEPINIMEQEGLLMTSAPLMMKSSNLLRIYTYSYNATPFYPDTHFYILWVILFRIIKDCYRFTLLFSGFTPKVPGLYNRLVLQGGNTN